MGGNAENDSANTGAILFMEAIVEDVVLRCRVVGRVVSTKTNGNRKVCTSVDTFFGANGPSAVPT